MQQDYGEIYAHTITQGRDFFAILDNLANEAKSGPSFYHNRSILLDAFVDHGLRVVETDDMFNRCASRDPIFLKSDDHDTTSLLLTPSLILIMWVQQEFRLQGLGRHMVDVLLMSLLMRAFNFGMLVV